MTPDSVTSVTVSIGISILRTMSDMPRLTTDFSMAAFTAFS